MYVKLKKERHNYEIFGIYKKYKKYEDMLYREVYYFILNNKK